jgi:hypothetical protein
MKRIYAGVFAIVDWFAIVGQYFASDHGTSIASTIDYFSYFTILSNILVAATLTFAALAPESPAGRFLLKPGTLLATVVYITVTGLTYYFVLAALYDLHGWELIFDRLLHYLMPPAFVLFWLAFATKGRLDIRSAAWVLLPPLIYAAYTFIRGPLSGFYPYPFVDVPEIGIVQAFLNVLKFIVFFFVVGLFYVLVDWLIARFSKPAPA